jgi:hypothetical protein
MYSLIWTIVLRAAHWSKCLNARELGTKAGFGPVFFPRITRIYTNQNGMTTTEGTDGEKFKIQRFKTTGCSLGLQANSNR